MRIVPAVRSRAMYGEPSRRFLGIEVRVCLIHASDSASLSSQPWSIDYADDTETQSIDEWWNGEFSEPLYPADRRVAVGQCVRSWIIKPLRGTPKQVAYAPDSGDPAFWRIP